MAYDLFRGHSPKNFAIQGHPPIHSFEYVMAGGGYCKPAAAPPPRRWKTERGARYAESGVGGPVDELRLPRKSGFYVYEISHSDWDAATRWMANLAENVAYTRKVHGERVLTATEALKFNDLWRRWLLFGNKIETVKRQLEDESLASKVLSATIPGLWASRLLYATAKGSLALMSADNKRELDKLLKEAWELYKRFRLMGLSQVAIPYMGDLVVILRTLPPEMTLSNMAARLRDGTMVGERLIDANTAWWQWRKRDETKGVRRAIDEAKKLASEIEDVAKTPPGQGLRDQGTPIYVRFVRTLAKIYVEAAGLYGVEETKRTAAAEFKDDVADIPRNFSYSLLGLLAAVGVGYVSLRWLATPKNTFVVSSDETGYHPETNERVDNRREHHFDVENKETR
jgi:hypothetical protein